MVYGLVNMNIDVNNSEVVAAMIDSIITTDKALIYISLLLKKNVYFITRPHMQFMAACDLGPIWDKLANAPTLFDLEKNNE